MVPEVASPLETEKRRLTERTPAPKHTLEVVSTDDPLYWKALSVSDYEFARYTRDGKPKSLEDKHDSNGNAQLVAALDEKGRILASMRIVYTSDRSRPQSLDIYDFIHVEHADHLTPAVSFGRFTINSQVLEERYPYTQSRREIKGMLLHGILTKGYAAVMQHPEHRGVDVKLLGIFIPHTAKFVRQNGIVILTVPGAGLDRTLDAVKQLEHDFPWYWLLETPFLAEFDSRSF